MVLDGSGHHKSSTLQPLPGNPLESSGTFKLSQTYFKSIKTGFRDNHNLD